MKAFTQHTGLVAPLDRANVDTDQIIPKQFLKSIKRTGFGPNLFDEWRYLDVGQPYQDNSKSDVDELFKQVEANEGYQLTIDLAAQTVTRPDGKVLSFEVDAFRKHCLLEGLDDIGLTLKDDVAIAAFETKHRASQPWLFRG